MKKSTEKVPVQEVTLPVYNAEGKEVETITLDPRVFDGVVNREAVYQAVNGFRANQRSGLAATKTRGEVSGGGKKPWKQKGTGRARVGSTRSPLWRHGGVVFGPHPRDYSYTVPQKIRALALKSSLNTKVQENAIVVLDALSASAPKTREVYRVFTNLKLTALGTGPKSGRVLLLLGDLGAHLKLALRNIACIDTRLAKDVNCYEVLAHKKLVVTKDGLKSLSERVYPSASARQQAPGKRTKSKGLKNDVL